MYERNVGITEPPHGSTPSGKPIAVPRSHGFHERRQSSRLIPVKSCSGDDVRTPSRPCRHAWIQRLADGEEADDEDHHVDAVEQLRDAEREPRVAGELVDADQAERQPEEQAEQPADDASRRAAPPPS